MRWFPSLVLPLVALAIGCASTGGVEWVKANTTDEQRERDKSECWLASTDTLPSVQGRRRVLNQDRYRRCLESRGYQLSQTPGPR
jgi:hypothetical protein